MGEHSRHKCHFLGDGVIACGETPTDHDLLQIVKFKRYLKGEMSLGEAREFAGLSVGQAAKLSGVPVETIRAAEAGEKPLDDISRLKLAKLYGVRK